MIYYPMINYTLYRKKIPPKEFHHSPDLQNNYGDTVAMLLAWNGIIPPKEWYHSQELKNKEDTTVAMQFANHKIIPP